MGWPINILVVDDRDDNRAAVVTMLAGLDYRLCEARSAAEALRILLDEEVALLLVEGEMPDMSGSELAELVHRRERTAAVPIILMIGHPTDRELLVRAARAGAIDCLTEPLVAENVRAKVAVFAQLHRQRKELEQHAEQQRELGLVDPGLASERRYRKLAEALPNIVWTARPDGTVDYFNQRWFEYTGISVERAAGSWSGAVHPDDLAACGAAWRRALDTGEVHQTECRLRRVDDAFRWHLCRAVPEHGAAGEIVAWLGSFTDIDDQRRANAVLAELKETRLERELLYREAVDAIRGRDEFLSVASHELRTPLSALQLQIEMLLEPPRRDPTAVVSPEQLKKKLEAAARQVDRLSLLITELLDVSRITARRLSLEREETDLAAVAREVIKRFAHEATKVRSPVELIAREPVVGRWDRARLEQIVTNLLTNAFKFGAGKPIEIAVMPDGANARLSVTDHGIGIAPEDAERIFHRYEHVVSTRPYGGLGLGLYIVRGLVEAHGGTIRVESQPHAGSTFTIELPRQPAPEETHAADEHDRGDKPPADDTDPRR